MRVCAAIKPDGLRCRARAMKGSEWCFNHHPDHSEARRRNASKGGRRGGRGRPGPAAAREVQAEVRDVIRGVLDGTVDRATAAVAFQGYNCLLRAVESERRLAELVELIERVEELERAADGQRGELWGT